MKYYINRRNVPEFEGKFSIALQIRDLSEESHDSKSSEAASSHCLRRGSTLALRRWGFNPTLDQGDATRPLGTPA